jgi:hypothetical protein
MRIRTTLLSLATVVLACAEGASSGSGAAADFKPTGSIVVASGNGASFNATQVNGPKVHVSQRSDGSWGGTINAGNSFPTPIDATFQGGQFVGANIRLSINREGGLTTIVGSVLDRIIRIELTEAEIKVRTGTKSLNFVKLPGEGEYGGAQSMKLVGEALQMPPTPAFALAMVGAFI